MIRECRFSLSCAHGGCCFASDAVAAGAFGSFRHLVPGPFGTFTAFADVGETGPLGSVMLSNGTSVEKLGIVDHIGCPCRPLTLGVLNEP